MNTFLNAMLNPFVGFLQKSGLLAKDWDYHLLRASMVIIFLFFGYQKWWEYEAERLVPFISNGPLISWLYPVFGMRGASWFLGTFEWIFGALLFAGFWDKRLGILGAAGSAVTFFTTVTIIPFMPDGWDASAGGFPAMTGNVEGCGAVGGLALPAEAGSGSCREGLRNTITPGLGLFNDGTAHDGVDTRTIRSYLGHKLIQHTPAPPSWHTLSPDLLAFNR